MRRFNFLPLCALLFSLILASPAVTGSGTYYRTAESRVSRFVSRGNVEGLKKLLERGDVNLKESERDYIELAVLNYDLEMVKFLMEQGLNLHFQKSEETGKYENPTLLRSVCDTDNLAEEEVQKMMEMVKFLIAQGFDVQEKTGDYGETLLYVAARNGNVTLARFLLEQGLAVDGPEECEVTPLSIAWEEGSSPETIELLLKAGAKTVFKDENGYITEVLLHNAVEGDDLELVKLLVENNAPLETFYAGGTALHAAMAGKGTEIAAYLLEKGANIEARTDYGWTPLMLAIMDDLETVKFFVEKGADIHAITDNDRDMLFLAAEWGREEVVDYFLELGLDPTRVNISGQGILFASAKGGNYDVFRKFVKGKSDLQVRDIWGQTLLFAAVAGENEKIIRFLIQNDVPINTPRNDGDTPMNLAREMSDLKIHALLRSLGGKETSNRVYGDSRHNFTDGGMGGMGMGGMGGIM